MTGRVLLLSLALAGCAAAGASEEAWVTVARDDLVLEVDVTGMLRATRAVPIGPPAVSETWDFKIVRMGLEGAEVKKGDPVLVFDTSEIERQLAERASERDAADEEIVKKKIDLDLVRREGEMRVSEAQATLRKAELKADLPAQYTAAIEMKLAKIDLDSARAELTGAQKRLEYQLKLGEAELAFLRERHARADARVQRLQTGVREMTVRSPVPGLISYRASWRGDKKKVGDSCWTGEGCLEVVDLSDITGKGEVDETESARVREGQPVIFRLEALPEMEWHATVDSLRPNVYRQSPRNPLKVIGVDLKLARTDRVRMRPGMLFRGRIETGRVHKAVLAPLDAVFVRDDGPIAFRRSAVGGHQKVRLQLGRRNARSVEVLSGLADGDQIARRDLERLAEEGR